MKVYNGGAKVSHTIEVDLITGGFGELVTALSEACFGLDDVYFETRSEIYNYGDSITNELIVFGRPTGKLAQEAEEQWKRRHA